MRAMTVTDFLGNFDWLLDRDQVTDVHWVLVAVFLGHLLTLLNWVLDWDLKYTMKGETEMLSQCSLGTLLQWETGFLTGTSVQLL